MSTETKDLETELAEWKQAAGVEADMRREFLARALVAEGKLREIEIWARAYPVEIFPEPDLAKAAELLKAGGLTLDAVSASAMRHVLKGLAKIVGVALPLE